MRYAFWNNKGGTGKTSLAFQTICEYAIRNEEKRILVVDMCPQANLSELFMGGLIRNGGKNLSDLYESKPRRSIGGYFGDRLSSPYRFHIDNASKYLSKPHEKNSNIPENIDLIAGDRIVELQSNSISSLSIQVIPNVDTYIRIIDWLNELIEELNKLNSYDNVFIDTNPSFAIYTQIALAASDRLIVPVMADDSSRRALHNVFSLVYGLRLRPEVDDSRAFSKRLTEASKHLPKIHLIVKNRLTQYMGPASAYAAVLSSIERDIKDFMKDGPEYFTFTSDNIREGIVEVRDFQTTGVVAYAEATPFSKLPIGNHEICGNNTQIQRDYLNNCISSIGRIVDLLH